MKTFAEFCKGSMRSLEFSLSLYLEYALGKMEKQLRIKMLPLLDMRPYGKQIEEAFDAGYKVGVKEGMSGVKANYYKLGHDD